MSAGLESREGGQEVAEVQEWRKDGARGCRTSRDLLSRGRLSLDKRRIHGQRVADGEGPVDGEPGGGMSFPQYGKHMRKISTLWKNMARFFHTM